MLTFERRRLIVQCLRSRGVVSAAEMAEDLGASVITVRRDLKAMAGEGLVLRTRGGAVLPDGPAREPPYAEKANQAAAEKAAIARVAVGMLRAGESIALGPGTSTLALARLLADIPELTVVTNSLLVPQALMSAPHIEVIMTGGTLRRAIHALVGPAAEESLRSLWVSKAFVAGNGLTVERGLSTPNPLMAAVDRALTAAAESVVVLADHTKIGRETMFQTLPLNRISTLITDARADPQQLAAFRDAGVSVLVADEGDGLAAAMRRSA